MATQQNQKRWIWSLGVVAITATVIVVAATSWDRWMPSVVGKRPQPPPPPNPVSEFVDENVDGTLPLQVSVAFPKLQWAGWSPIDDRGRPQPFRPVLLTHAGDGSNRVFVATQRGMIHVFPDDQDATQSKIFLNLVPKVSFKENLIEEGFLGLAFHPNYQQNGEFFAYYTSRESPHLSVISRFRVSEENPDRADPNSEEEILRISQPFYNHNGGTLAFGPDGYLYIALGDGGGFSDPSKNGQNLDTLLGSMLRIDIDRKENDKNYAIPADNPFVDQADARGEIWAYGLRNVWRLAFDSDTGALWAADVGQDSWEEINLITKGGNYGWNKREGMHSFRRGKAGPDDDFIDPIWEYGHKAGKSITGGMVYRGSRLPELQGSYVYADFVSGKLFALRYDEQQKKVISNHRVSEQTLAVLSFGADEDGNLYFTTVSAKGQGIHRFDSAAP